MRTVLALRLLSTNRMCVGGASRQLAKATYVNSYRGGSYLLYTNPPGVSPNRLELKKQMRYFFCAKIFCVLQKNVLGKIFSLSGREWPLV